VPDTDYPGSLCQAPDHPETASHWSDRERKAIRKLARAFRPEWSPPAGEFSAWHFLLLKPTDAEGTYHYSRPVVVLLDGGSYSATDIFLGALAGWRGVTLVGTPSGGGSGRSRPVTLAHSGLDLRVSSMASFRRDGKLYDGRGVQPDVTV
jgi:hypothetical protein